MRYIFYFIYFIISISCMGKELIEMGVPFNQNDMYLYKNLELGEYKGVYVDIISKSKLKKNVDFKIINNNSDIFLRTSQKNKELNYIKMPIIYKISVLTTKDSNVKSIGSVKLLKVAYINDSQGLNQIKERYPNIEIREREVNNIKEGLEYLDKNLVDIFIVKDWYEKNRNNEEYTVIENIKYNEYIGLRKNLTEEFDGITKILNSMNIKELKEITDKNRIEFYQYLLKDTPNYERVKKKYKKLRIKIGNDVNLPPFYYEKNGRKEGLLINIGQDIEKILEIPVEFVKDEDFEINGIAIANYIKGKRDDLYEYTNPYYSMKIGVINKKESVFVDDFSDLDESTVLVYRDSRLKELLENKSKNLKIIELDTYNEGIESLLKKESDYFIGSLSVLTGFISNTFNNDNLKIAGIFNEVLNISLSVKKENTELSEVLNFLSEGFVVEKNIYNNKLLENIIVEKNYKLMLKIGIPLLVFIFILCILLYIINVDRKKEKNLKNSLVTILEMANELNDEDTGDHIKRIALYSEIFSEKLNFSKKITEQIKKYSELHDIGKIGIPNELLNKKTKLTEEEYEIVKEHVILGYDFIKKLNLGPMAENIIKYHHEKWNGSGYPEKLKGENIPLEARIVSLIDVYDTLRQKKSYKESFSHEEAMNIIKNESGISFDPKLVEIFIENNKNFSEIFVKNKEYLRFNKEIYKIIKKK